MAMNRLIACLGFLIHSYLLCNLTMESGKLATILRPTYSITNNVRTTATACYSLCVLAVKSRVISMAYLGVHVWDFLNKMFERIRTKVPTQVILGFAVGRAEDTHMSCRYVLQEKSSTPVATSVSHH